MHTPWPPELASGKTIDMLALAMGNTSGVIGSSALGLLAGLMLTVVALDYAAVRRKVGGKV